MSRYLLRRLGHAVMLLFVISLLSFALTELAPGDFFDQLRLDPQVSAETVEALRVRYGLDRPLPARYLRWVGSTLRGEMGYSFALDQPVSRVLWPRLRNTLLLTVTATLIAWLVALPLGIWVAAQPRRWARALFGAGTSLLLALPDLLLGLLVTMLAARTGWFPIGGMRAAGSAELGAAGRLADLAHHMVLPVAALVLAMAPSLARHVHSAMAEVLASPFVQAVRGAGIPRRRLLLRYALPVAANPLISLLGFSIAGLLSASLLIEIIVTWPGLGPLLLDAALARDPYVVVAAVMASSVLLIGGNLGADLLLFWIDPRIRREGETR